MNSIINVNGRHVEINEPLRAINAGKPSLGF